jgi:hypothetical protein
MFAVAGVAFAKMLPADKSLRILGIPNRWFFAVANSIFCVFVEVLLNKAGVLVWEYPWWDLPMVGLVFLVGYLPRWDLGHIMEDTNKIATVAAICAAHHNPSLTLNRS